MLLLAAADAQIVTLNFKNGSESEEIDTSSFSSVEQLKADLGLASLTFGGIPLDTFSVLEDGAVLTENGTMHMPIIWFCFV